MKKSKVTRPRDHKSQPLADAETQLGIAAVKYNETGSAQLSSLVAVCSKLTDLKESFRDTPKCNRPKPTWKEFVVDISARFKLGFASARMADLCIALNKDIKEVGLEKVKALVPDGSYRGARSAINILVGKPKVNAPKSVEKTNVNALKKRAAGHLLRALDNIAAAEKLLPKGAKSEIEHINASIKAVLNGSAKSGQPVAVSQPSAPIQADPIAPASKISKEGLSDRTKATFTPKDVAEIAKVLGGKAALGKAAGKRYENADYWIKVNKLPAKLQDSLVKAFIQRGERLDLSLIPLIGKVGDRLI